MSAMNFESRCPTVDALAHDPRHRATIGNDEIGHLTEVDDAGIYEAPNAGDREKDASGGDVDDHDACTPVSTPCVLSVKATIVPASTGAQPDRCPRPAAAAVLITSAALTMHAANKAPAITSLLVACYSTRWIVMRSTVAGDVAAWYSSGRARLDDPNRRFELIGFSCRPAELDAMA